MKGTRSVFLILILCKILETFDSGEPNLFIKRKVYVSNCIKGNKLKEYTYCISVICYVLQILGSNHTKG